MAKKKTDKNNDILDDVSMIENESGSSKAATIIITVLIVIVWLGIFAALIKFDIMGFGSKVMAPIIEDIPVINKLLPDSMNDETTDNLPYKSIAECATYIKELENEIATYQQNASDNSTKIADLEAEVTRLKKFEENQKSFEELKSKFYEEVVFGENAIDTDEYIKYYESIDKENADLLYQRAVEKYAYDEVVKERAKYYSSMDAKQAAAIFCEMTGDLDIVVSLLNSMTAAQSGEILGAISDIDSVYAAKLTKKLMP